MKKMKKIILVIMASVLFFMQPALTSVNNKYYQDHYNNNVKVEAGAVTTYLTWEAMKAAALAAGSAVAPVAVGVVGAAAIGWVVDETIGWDVVADYGQGIINHVLSLGGTVDDIYDSQTETVNLTNEFVTGAAHAVDSLPDSKIVDYNGWIALAAITLDANNPIHEGYEVNLRVNSGDRLVIRGDYSIYGGNEYAPFTTTPGFTFKYADQSDNKWFERNFGATTRLSYGTGEFESISATGISAGFRGNSTIEKVTLSMPTTYERSISISNLRMLVIGGDNLVAEDVIFDDYAIKDSLPATVEDRKELMTNTIGGVGSIALQDTQAVTGVTFPEMVSANTPEDMDESTANDLGILGILLAIYNFIKSLPVRIVGAFTSLFNSIINAIMAIPDVITSGVDNLLINVNALGNTLAGSHDDLLIDVNALGNSLWGSLDELLIDVNALANSLASSFGGLLINLGTWFDSLINAVGSITGSVTGAIAELLISILNGVIALPTTLVNILVPDFSLVADKFGGIKLKMRDNPFTAFTGTLKNVFDMRKSIFDIRVTIKDKEYPLVPIALKSGLDTARNFLTGAIILIGSTIFYTRAKGMSWWK